MIALKLVLEGLGLGFLLYLICAIGIRNGAVGMVHLHDQKVQERVVQLGLSTADRDPAFRSAIDSLGLYAVLNTEDGMSHNKRRTDITCLDYSENMMASAQEKAKVLGLPNIKFLQGDVGALPFEDESFDIVQADNGLWISEKK